MNESADVTPEVQRLYSEIQSERRAASTARGPCGCAIHERCPEAVRLRQAHSAAWEAHDTPAIVEAREAYGTHLRQAGGKPGRARWEEDRCRG